MSILNFLMLCEDRPTGSSRIERLEGANLPDGILFRSTIDQEPHPPTVHICYAPGCRIIEPGKDPSVKVTDGPEIIGIENVLPAGFEGKLLTADEHTSNPPVSEILGMRPDGGIPVYIPGIGNGHCIVYPNPDDGPPLGDSDSGSVESSTAKGGMNSTDVASGLDKIASGGNSDGSDVGEKPNSEMYPGGAPRFLKDNPPSK